MSLISNTTENLPNSKGWNSNPKMFIDLTAPFISVPINGVKANSMNDTNTMG